MLLRGKGFKAITVEKYSFFFFNDNAILLEVKYSSCDFPYYIVKNKDGTRVEAFSRTHSGTNKTRLGINP